MQCEICNKQCVSIAGLAKHLHNQHSNITEQEYFDTYLKTATDGYCSYCNKQTKFISLTKGYAKTCGHSCAKYAANIRYKLRTGFNSPAANPEVQHKRKTTCLNKYGIKHFNNINKANETCIAKYGMTLQEKAKQTAIQKYGTRNNYEKIKQTNLKKYGCEHSFQSDYVQHKIKQTNLKKYGYEYASCSESVKQKISQANKQYYNTIEKRKYQFDKMITTYKNKTRL